MDNPPPKDRKTAFTYVPRGHGVWSQTQIPGRNEPNRASWGSLLLLLLSPFYILTVVLGKSKQHFPMPLFATLAKTNVSALCFCTVSPQEIHTHTPL